MKHKKPKIPSPPKAGDPVESITNAWPLDSLSNQVGTGLIAGMTDQIAVIFYFKIQNFLQRNPS